MLQRERAHALVDKLFDLRDSLVGKAVPPAAARHFRAARREALLGIRELVDHALMALDAEGPEGEGTDEPKPIPVEE